jgi:hypothetical protein
MKQTMKLPAEILARECQLGDVVQTSPFVDASYADATVVRITDTEIYLFRPYVHTSDFSYSGNRIIPYVGFEQYQIYPESRVRLIYRRSAPVL